MIKKGPETGPHPLEVVEGRIQQLQEQEFDYAEIDAQILNAEDKLQTAQSGLKEFATEVLQDATADLNSQDSLLTMSPENIETLGVAKEVLETAQSKLNGLNEQRRQMVKRNRKQTIQ
jgi:uncharacterized protein with von Willebrand factor type A (vWA) domain